MSRLDEIKRAIVAELRRQNVVGLNVAESGLFEYLDFNMDETRATLDSGELDLNDLAAAIDIALGRV